jgi:hypothetical protein
MVKLEFRDKEELKAFIRILHEIILELESSAMLLADPFKRYELKARQELLEDILPKVERKQFNQQKKNSIQITKALALVIFIYREIAVDVYADMLKHRIVEHIHREMV